MEEQQKSVAIEKPVNSRKKLHRNPGVLLAAVALLFAILAAGELGFHEQEMSKKLEASHNELQQNQTAISSLKDQLTDTQNQFQQQQTLLNQLQQQTIGKQDSWVLAEVNYLVNQANYHVRFDRDIEAAIALLQTADQRLAGLDDPKLLDLRQSLAHAITDLQAVPKVDLPGILLRLTTLQEKIVQLPLRIPVAMSEKTITKSTPLNWQEALQNSWHTLKQLIVVRRIDQPVMPLLSVEQQVYLQQNVQILLQQAAFTALRNQNVVYQNSLNQALDLIQRYYAPDSPITQAVVQSLHELQAIDVAPQLPDLTDVATIAQKIAGHGV